MRLRFLWLFLAFVGCVAAVPARNADDQVARVLAPLLIKAESQLWCSRCTSVQVVIYDSQQINAELDSRNAILYITVDLLRYVQTDDELAFVLSHELAHFVFNDGTSIYERELGADLLALWLLRDAGFNAAAAVAVMRRLANDFSGIELQRYPPFSIRAQLMEHEIRSWEKS